MDCTEFLARHSEFLDGEPVEDLYLFEEHLHSCRVCARYDRVVRRGVELCRGLPAVDASPDFEERLRSRLTRLEEELVAGPRFGGSTALAVVLILGFIAAAWLPAVVHRHEVALPPIVVTWPKRPAVALRIADGPMSFDRVSLFSAGWAVPAGRLLAMPVSVEALVPTLWDPSLWRRTLPAPQVSLSDQVR
ncbi:MAG: hypothetical protein HY702_01570 [Gemmatimonadetes bacterium]|nr:hypothetical protein [Gemmatimonadota bacterium]